MNPVMRKNAVIGPRADGAELPAGAVRLHVRFADVDMMGVVHHSAYFHWFEQIRFEFLWNIMGVEWATLRENGLAFPVTRCSVDYVRAVRFEDRPIGYTRLAIHKTATFTLHYEILDWERRRRFAVGSTTHCYVGRQGTLLLRPPAPVLAGFERVRSRFPQSVVGAGEGREQPETGGSE